MGKINHILLTGATGYLGRNLLRGFIEAEYEVSILVRTSSNLNLIGKDINKIKIFYSDKGQSEKAFLNKSIDAIVHTAALYGRKGESVVEVTKANLLFPLELLNFAVKYGVINFINTDTTLPRALNTYSLSKKQFLDWLVFYASSLRILNLEMEYFYGPNDDSSKFITFVLRQLQLGKADIDFTEATQFRDFIYIDDVVSAYLTILRQINNFKGFVSIPVGSGKAVMLKDIIKEVQSAHGNFGINLNFGKLPMRLNEVMYSCADITLLNSLDWFPRYALTDGLKKIIELEK